MLGPAGERRCYKEQESTDTEEVEEAGVACESGFVFSAEPKANVFVLRHGDITKRIFNPNRDLCP